jgi:hypothetical protein
MKLSVSGRARKALKRQTRRKVRQSMKRELFNMPDWSETAMMADPFWHHPC